MPWWLISRLLCDASAWLNLLCLSTGADRLSAELDALAKHLYSGEVLQPIGSDCCLECWPFHTKRSWQLALFERIGNEHRGRELIIFRLLNIQSEDWHHFSGCRFSWIVIGIDWNCWRVLDPWSDLLWSSRDQTRNRSWKKRLTCPLCTRCRCDFSAFDVLVSWSPLSFSAKHSWLEGMALGAFGYGTGSRIFGERRDLPRCATACPSLLCGRLMMSVFDWCLPAFLEGSHSTWLPDSSSWSTEEFSTGSSLSGAFCVTIDLYR